MVIQYADDLLICSVSKQQCEQDSIIVLTALAKGGHKVSKDKLQFCSQEVKYLGQQLRGNERLIAPSQVEELPELPNQNQRVKCCLFWEWHAIADHG